MPRWTRHGEDSSSSAFSYASFITLALAILSSLGSLFSECVLQLQVRLPDLFSATRVVKGIGHGRLPTSGLRLAPLALLSTSLSLFILPAAQTGVFSSERRSAHHWLGLGIAGTADGLLPGSRFSALVWLLSLYSFCYRGFFLDLCTQGFLGCLVDLRKPSYAGGLRDAVKEVRANLQSQLLPFSTTVLLPSGHRDHLSSASALLTCSLQCLVPGLMMARQPGRILLSLSAYLIYSWYLCI